MFKLGIIGTVVALASMIRGKSLLINAKRVRPPIRGQAKCASYRAFGAIELSPTDSASTYGKVVILSLQDMVSCDPNNHSR
jgi:hypothetical protein